MLLFSILDFIGEVTSLILATIRDINENIKFFRKFVRKFFKNSTYFVETFLNHISFLIRQKFIELSTLNTFIPSDYNSY